MKFVLARLSQLGLVAVIVSALFAGAALPVFAATTGSIKVINEQTDGWVQVQIDNLPADTLFTATIGPAGSQGYGGYVVGDLPTEGLSTHIATFEIPQPLVGSASLDLRVEAPGYLYLVTFSNSSTVAATTNSSTASIPVTGASSVAAPAQISGPIDVVNEEQDGWVQVEVDKLPADTLFTATIGAAGTQGMGGYVVGNLPTEDLSSHLATFEIPQPLVGSASLDLRLEAPGYLYVTTFKNSSTAAVIASNAAVTTVASTAAASSAPASGPIKVLHAEQDGWVQVQIDNLPADTLFNVMIGASGSQGFGGYGAGNMPTDSLSTHIATFEIPQPLVGSASLDLRVSAPGYLYVVTFNNSTH